MALTRITQGVIEPNQNYDTHNINSTGIITATGANISGNMSVGGVLTYEDVTNVDSVGLVTARQGMRFGGHILPTVDSTYDIGSADYKVRHLFLSDNSLKFVDSSDTEHPLSVDSGRLKFAGGMLLGNNIKMDTTLGIVTATSFVGSGLNINGDITDAKGNIRRIPLDSYSSSHTLVVQNAGETVYISSGGVTIPSGVFSAGDAITIINNSGSNQTITCSAVTTYLAGDTSVKSSLTLKGRGMATFYFATASVVYGSGAGLE